MKSLPGYSNGVRQKVSKSVTMKDREDEQQNRVIEFRKISNGWIKHESWRNKEGLQTLEPYMENHPDEGEK